MEWLAFYLLNSYSYLACLPSTHRHTWGVGDREKEREVERNLPLPETSQLPHGKARNQNLK